jgi:histidine triad (HIT) family protein
MAFMGIRPIHEGECMVIPKQHIDHFTDIDDALTCKIILVAQRIGKKMLEVLSPKPLRIGSIVHGFGVAHAHYIIVPQHDETDIVSMRHLKIENNQIIADERLNPLVPRDILDQVAKKLAIGDYL